MEFLKILLKRFQQDGRITALKRQPRQEPIVKEGVHSGKIEAFQALEQPRGQAESYRQENYLKERKQAVEDQPEQLLKILLSGEGGLEVQVKEPHGLHRSHQGQQAQQPTERRPGAPQDFPVRLRQAPFLFCQALRGKRYARIGEQHPETSEGVKNPIQKGIGRSFEEERRRGDAISGCRVGGRTAPGARIGSDVRVQQTCDQKLARVLNDQPQRTPHQEDG